MKLKPNEQLEAQTVMIIIGEVFSRMRYMTGHEVVFGHNDDMFFIAKDKELIIGNNEMIVKCGAKGLQQKTINVIKDFGLTYDILHEMEMEPMSFKTAVRKVEEWLGLPL